MKYFRSDFFQCYSATVEFVILGDQLLVNRPATREETDILSGIYLSKLPKRKKSII